MRFLRLKEVITKTGLSRSSIYQFMNDGIFPKSVSLGSRSVAWVEGEVIEWMESKIFARDMISATNSSDRTQ